MKLVISKNLKKKSNYVDASLDVVAVSRLSWILRYHPLLLDCRFCVVTHRPEMYENATRIIGVYSVSNGRSSVVCASFENQSSSLEYEELHQRLSDIVSEMKPIKFEQVQNKCLKSS
eukprot:GHVL01021722.1.p1 GENE.GHVL01021722.1~~GHVL01021722.1.p1  ORF type:complete len:117 (-),score=21.06 GHVL01021722.1:339-689(-)